MFCLSTRGHHNTRNGVIRKQCWPTLKWIIFFLYNNGIKSISHSFLCVCVKLDLSCCGWIWGLTFGVSIGKEAVPGHFRAERQRQEIVPGLGVDDAVEILLRGRAQDPWRHQTPGWVTVYKDLNATSLGKENNKQSKNMKTTSSE